MRKWDFYTANEIKPKGWMRRQLEIQAKGLSGNLDKIWPDVRDSAWIGGDREGWERVPYWLDGFIPLAYLLEDEDMIARAKKYIDAILAAQKEDGWICPCDEKDRPTYDSWGVQLISKVLTVYYECSLDERIPDALYRVLKNYFELLKSSTIKLFDWGKARWFEALIAIRFLYERKQEDWLIHLAKLLKEQGTDYNTLTDRWVRPLNKWTFETHIVNITMMLKYEALYCDLLGEPYADRAERLRQILKTYNGTAVETFTGDECLSGLSPIQGTELCAVVEQMYSYEHLFAYSGDPKWAERLEKLAFNALPATISEDMWTHQYDQLSNQIACITFPGKPIFRTNGKEAHLFGLEPNFGCCTANFNQGWPKLTLSAFMHQGNTVINALPIPSMLQSDGVSILLETNYPFENSFTYKIEAKKDTIFKIRIPSFAKNLLVDGAAADTSELSFEIGAGEQRTITLSFETAPKLKQRPHHLHSIEYGSLVFSLPISYEKRMLEYERKEVERKFPYCDYELLPCSEWSYGLASPTLSLKRAPLSEIPFSEKNPPLRIKAALQKIAWGLEDGYEWVCAKSPQSTVPLSEPQELELIPYGCAKLRMTELPLIK